MVAEQVGIGFELPLQTASYRMYRKADLQSKLRWL
jgi:hypothetical protein